MRAREDLTPQEAGEAILGVSEVVTDVVAMVTQVMQAVNALTEILEEGGYLTSGQQQALVAGMKTEAEKVIRRGRG